MAEFVAEQAAGGGADGRATPFFSAAFAAVAVVVAVAGAVSVVVAAMGARFVVVAVAVGGVEIFAVAAGGAVGGLGELHV